MVLRNLSFKMHNNEKVALLGKVGSGKTSLFLTILRELCLVKGTVKVSSKKHIGYVEQTPLIMTGTVRDNIVFGATYEKGRYESVVSACALKEDFSQLANGDLTKLGEMGMQLSGGQKSRIALARALYQKEAKILLIDGALSALDSRVARHIMTHAIKGPLCKDKIVILITYDLDQAADMDYVMLLEEGAISQFKRSDDFFSNTQVLQRLRQEISTASSQNQDQPSDST